MMPPDTQPVSVVCFSFSQQQSSKQWCVLTSGHSSLQHSSQQKQGFSFGLQQHKWPSFLWQQLSQPQPQLLQESQPQLGAAAQVGAAALQPGAAALQLGAGAGAGAGAAPGAGAGVGCAAVL